MSVLSNCAIVEEIITSPEIDLLDNSYCEVPQLSIRELDNLTNIYTNSVYWRVSKGFSVLEMNAFAGMEGFDGAILAAKPVVIYGWDGAPKYFEWRVFKDGGIVGAIVANASKLVCRPVTYVLRMVNSYGILTNYPADTVVIDDDYPYFAFGKVDTNTLTVTEAIDPFAGTNIAVKKEIFTLMKESPELFYDSPAEQLELRLFTELYPVYSKSWWADVDEAQMIAVSYLGPIAVSSNKGLSPLAEDWHGFRVLNGFTGVKKDGWWDIDWVQFHLKWNPNSAYWMNPDTGGWCGPTAGAIMMCYYGYTNKIKWYTYKTTNYLYYYAQKSTNFTLNLEKLIDIRPFAENYMKVNVIFYSPGFDDYGGFHGNSIYYLYGSATPEPNNFNTTLMYTSCGYSIPNYLFRYNFQYSAITLMDHFYTRFHFGFDIKVSNNNISQTGNPTLLSGAIEFRKDTYPNNLLHSEPFSYELLKAKVSTNTPLSLNPQEWVFIRIVTNITTHIYDGYYVWGTIMGIRNWREGGVSETYLKKGLEWACNDSMTFKTTYCDPLTYLWSIIDNYYHKAVFDDTKNCIEADKPIAIARFKYYENSSSGHDVDAHWRVGIGYHESTTPYSSTIYKYILIADNGAEYLHNNAIMLKERSFISTINSNYCPYIFWENPENMFYDYSATVYQE